MADVFVSYSAVDRERVRPIVAALQSQDWTVWWDRNIKPGPNFEREIEKALDAARCVVVLWSSHSVESDWVRTEASEGLARKILVPVQIDAVDMPLSFRYLQTANLSGWDGARDDEDFRNFVDAVAELLGAPEVLASGNYRTVTPARVAAAEPAEPVLARPSIDPATDSSSAADSGELEKPSGWRRVRPFAAVLAGLGIVAIAALFLVDRLAPRDIPWVAVLPFTQTGFEPQQNYIGDGLAAELINELSGRAGIRVASRTASFYFKDKRMSVADIATTLNANVLVEGDVKDTAAGVQLDVRLLDTDTGHVRWADSLQLPLDQLAEMRYVIAERIVAELLGQASVPTANAARSEVSGEAYEHYLRGYELLGRPQTQRVVREAKAAFGSALQLERNFAGAHAGLCEAYLHDYDQRREQVMFDAAEKSCANALRTAAAGADNWRVHVALGNLYVAAGAVTKGIESLQTAARERPASAEIERYLGEAFAALGDDAKAEEHFRSSIALEPTFWDAYVSLGSFYYNNQRYAESVASFEEVLRMVPQLPSAVLSLGSAYYMSGDKEKAAASWRQAEALGDAVPIANLAVSYSNLGLERYYAGDFEEAVTLHKKAAGLLPHDHRFWGRIAESYRGLGDAVAERANYERAVEMAEATIERQPADWETLGLLALYYGFLGDSERSSAYAARTEQTAPKNPTALYFLSLAHAALGQDEQVFARLEQALGLGFSSTLIAQDRDLSMLRERYPERFAGLVAD